MDQIKFFETVIEPSTERLGLFGIAHDINFDGRNFVVSHKVSKNVFTEFDGKLSRYLAAVTGMGLPGASVETRIRDVTSGRSWAPYPIRHLSSVPEALSTAAKLALGSESQARVRLGAWMSEDTGLEQERLLTLETVSTLQRALTICRQIGATEFLEISGDLDRVLVRPARSTMDMVMMDLARGTISIPTTSEMAGVAYQGPLFGFNKAVRQTPAVNTFLGRARHAVAIAKEDAIHEFRQSAEARIREFDSALAGRRLSGHRMEGAISLVARLRAGLGDNLLGLSEAAQVTALDWAEGVQTSDAPRLTGGDDPNIPPGPRLVS